MKADTTKKRRTPASYQQALEWIVLNDDTEWLESENEPIISVTASLVADLYGRTEEEIIADLRGCQKRTIASAQKTGRLNRRNAS